jgi:preprotein translocase subunit SecE
MATTNPIQFIQQVRAEVAKVVWPTRREVALTTAMVFVMAVLTAIFFFFVDWLIRQGLGLVLGVFGG